MMSNLRHIICTLLLFAIASQVAVATQTKHPTLVFFGDSLTAGYGIQPDLAYPALIQKKITAAQLNYQVVPAGVSGDTSAGGLRRIRWVMRRPIDIFVLALGANDGLRGTTLDQTEKNLQGIIDAVKSKNPQAQLVLAGMEMPPNLGESYRTQFREMYPRLAETNQATLIPFLLQDVAGVPSLNQADRIHPTAEGHAIMAETVWKHLEPLIASEKKSVQKP